MHVSFIAQLMKNLPVMQEALVGFLGQEDPLEKGQVTHSRMLGLPRWLRQQRMQCGRSGFNPQVGKIIWRRKWQPTPVFLPEKLYGQRSLVGYFHEVAKSWTRLK